MQVPCSIDDPSGVIAHAYDGDLYQQQVVLEKPLSLLLFFLHQEVNLQLLKAPSSWVDQRYCSDLWQIQTKMSHGHKNQSNSLSCQLHHTRLFLFPTWAAVFDGDEGCKVLGVVAKNDWVFVALCGQPVQWQINPTHIQRRDGGARFHTPDHLVC